MSTLDLAYYGDDFTGSTDVLEVLATAGVETVLFLKRPGPEWLARFPNCRAVGLAGNSRGQSPKWMDENLPGVFTWLKSLGARICHYKVCSTFDSSPLTGSIGRAIDLGTRVFESPFVPVLVGAPALRRYVVFGNLFASADGQTFRIDRHPTMSRHPVTPMGESDLRLHLAQQTGKRMGLVDLLALRSGECAVSLDKVLSGGAEVVLFDTFDDESIRQAGCLLWDRCPAPQAFVAGSSGVEYALVAHWRPRYVPPTEAIEVDRIAVLSGSCSPVTIGQIRWATANGFVPVTLGAAKLAGGDGREADMEAATAKARAALSEGRSPVIYSAGPGQDRAGLDAAGREALANLSGAVFREVLLRTGVRRAVVAGGDTSSHVGAQLDIMGLTFQARLAPGAPLCRAFSESPDWDGLEIVFKGGQCGDESFFEQVRCGTVLNK